MDLQRLLVKAAAEPGALVGGKLSVQKLESIFGATLQAKDALLSKLATRANVAKVLPAFQGLGFRVLTLV